MADNGLSIMFQLILTSAIILGGFYFILLRPVMQQQRKTKRDLLELQVGDEVVTTGGLLARVVDIRQPASGPLELILELAPGVTVRALTTAIQERRVPTMAEPPAGPGEEMVAELQNKERQVESEAASVVRGDS
jgi:preprotein translocase YajC subunit